MQPVVGGGAHRLPGLLVDVGGLGREVEELCKIDGGGAPSGSARTAVRARKPARGRAGLDQEEGDVGIIAGERIR